MIVLDSQRNLEAAIDNSCVVTKNQAGVPLTEEGWSNMVRMPFAINEVDEKFILTSRSS
jgi:hypothetical protein